MWRHGYTLPCSADYMALTQPVNLAWAIPELGQHLLGMLSKTRA